MPLYLDDTLSGYPLSAGSLASGYAALAARLCAGEARIWRIDGMSGVPWHTVEASLKEALGGEAVALFDMNTARLPVERVRERLAGGDPEFGRLVDGTLADFFDPDGLARIGQAAQEACAGGAVVVIVGQGSALIDLDGPLAWIELPKDAIRAAGKSALLGGAVYPLETALSSVDLPLTRAHKAALLPRLELYIDLSDKVRPVFLEGAALRASLHTLSERPFRTRRVAYPSAWGGQYLKQALALAQSPSMWVGLTSSWPMRAASSSSRAV